MNKIGFPVYAISKNQATESLFSQSRRNFRKERNCVENATGALCSARRAESIIHFPLQLRQDDLSIADQDNPSKAIQKRLHRRGWRSAVDPKNDSGQRRDASELRVDFQQYIASEFGIVLILCN